MIQSFQLGRKNAKLTGRFRRLNTSPDNQLFLRPIGNANFSGLRRQRRCLNRSIMRNCATGATRVAHHKFLSLAIITLLQYVSRGQ